MVMLSMLGLMGRQDRATLSSKSSTREHALTSRPASCGSGLQPLEDLRDTPGDTSAKPQLPCWRHLSPEIYRELQHPQTRVRRSSRSRRRRCSIVRPRRCARQEMWDAYSWFVGAFRQAAEKLKAGDRNAAFPPGCFPPALPFVPA